MLLVAGKPVAVTHSRGKGPQVKTDGLQLAGSATASSDASVNSLAEVSSCSYEARQVSCLLLHN